MLRISSEISSTILNWTYCGLATELFISITEEVTEVTIINQIILIAGDRVGNGRLTVTDNDALI
jgi:hypothetical protein